MRDDMEKQITECYRYKYDVTGQKKREQRLGMENLPKQESMRISNIRGWNKFEFGENLSPLYNFLESCVGRPWNDVYSEIRAGISCDSTIGAHVLQHVWDKVVLHCYEEDGKVYDSKGKELTSGYRFWNLYVAQDGILKRVPRPHKSKLEKLYDVCLRSEHVDFRFDYYRRKRGRWQKAVLYHPGQKVDRGNSQRIIPVDVSRYTGNLFVVDEAKEETGETTWYGRRRTKPVYDWVYTWRDVSAKEAERLGLDNVDSFYEASRNSRWYSYRQSRKQSEPLTEEKFREILRASKESNTA